MQSGYLELIIGPMGSGKTTKIFEKLGECFIMGYKCVYINHNSDIREAYQCIGENVATTHSPNPVGLNTNIENKSVYNLEELDLESYQVIGIDEAHFYDDLFTVVKHLLSQGKMVYCAGLNCSSEMENIGQISMLYNISDNIIFERALCKRCYRENRNKHCIIKNASFTKRLCQSKEKIHVGGMTDYEPVCRFHYEN